MNHHEVTNQLAPKFEVMAPIVIAPHNVPHLARVSRRVLRQLLGALVEETQQRTQRLVAKEGVVVLGGCAMKPWGW